MIVARLNGGLGNQMFQYAMGYRMAKERNAPFAIDASIVLNHHLRSYALGDFRIAASPLSNKELVDLGALPRRLPKWLARPLGNPLIEVLERQCPFDPAILESGDHCLFVGYWQTEKYFAPFADDIRAQYQLKEPMTAPRRATAGLIGAGNAVSVHVRRSDYITNPANVAFHGACSAEWYSRAMKMMAERVASPEFFVFSDDPDWARANLPRDWPAHFIAPSEDRRDCEDMKLMSLCRHHIVANSSFSWWGAWLNPSTDKQVIAPARWFNQESMDSRDLTPDSWIRL